MSTTNAVSSPAAVVPAAPPPRINGATTLEQRIPRIPLELIQPSKTNAPNRLNENNPEDKEFIESVRRHGVLQAILVRPLSGDLGGKHGVASYELVMGERRYRAAQLTGQASVPAEVRVLTDEQALELQLVENLQRKGVPAIAEGRGYTQLLTVLAKQNPKRGSDGQGVRREDLVQQIATRVDKSPRYIYARMKLCELIPELQKDLEDGLIDVSHADELVRLTPKDQKELRAEFLYIDERVQEMDQERYESAWKVKQGKRAISVRNLKVIIEREYQLTLDKAKFPIASADLKPVPCTACQKNTAVNSLLPPAAKATCTDKECWRGKMAQHVQAQGKAIAAKNETPKLVQITLAHHVYGENHKNIVTRQDWKTSKPGECKSTVAAAQVDVQNQVKHYTMAKAVCTDKKCKTHWAPKPATSSTTSSAYAPGVPAKKLSLADFREKHQERREEFLEERAAAEFARQTLAKVDKLGERELRMLAAAWLECNGYLDPDLLALVGLEKAGNAHAAVDKAKAADLPRLLLAMAFSYDLEEGETSAQFAELGKARGVDRARIKLEAAGKLKTCRVCGCFEESGCQLAGGKRCAWVKGEDRLCSNPLCLAEAEKKKPAAAQTSAKKKTAKAKAAKGGR